MLRSAKTQIDLLEAEVENQSITALMGTNNNNNMRRLRNQSPWKDVFCTASCALDTSVVLVGGPFSVMDVVVVFVILMAEGSVKH